MRLICQRYLVARMQVFGLVAAGKAGAESDLDFLVEIIGEAANRLTPETQALFPKLPFRQRRGMRNIIAHDDGEVDIEKVWQTASLDMDVLIQTREPT